MLALKARPRQATRAADFVAFVQRESDWLDDYALFRALRDRFASQPWWQWPDGLGPRQPSALAAAIFEHDRVEEQRVELDRLIEGLGDVATLPFLPVDALKAPDIASLARWLTPQGQETRDQELTREREEATR